MFVLTLVLAVACRHDLDLRRLYQPPVVLLACFLLYAGASISWAFSPGDAFPRWVLAVMITVMVMLPATLRNTKADYLAGIFWCYAVAVFINGIFVLTTPPMMTWENEVLGHSGYMLHKQYLGMCASIAIMISSYLLVSGRRHILPSIVIGLSIWLIVESKSKTSLGFLVLAFIVALAATVLSSRTKWSVAAIVTAIPVSFLSASMVIHSLAERLSYRIYGDPTFTGRVFIWDFIQTQTAQKPWFGWGFHSFWFVPFSPSLSAPGFVREMPSSHSGYLDMRLENGYFGLFIFLAALVAALYGLERVRRSDPKRALFTLSILIYIMLMNLLETIWFVPFDPLWIVFLVLVAATACHSEAAFPKPSFVLQARIRHHRYPHSLVRPFA
ncbi:MAG: O-antigen ligase family protein [Hyphomicrobiaceae bacterium]